MAAGFDKGFDKLAAKTACMFAQAVGLLSRPVGLAPAQQGSLAHVYSGSAELKCVVASRKRVIKAYTAAVISPKSWLH